MPRRMFKCRILLLVLTTWLFMQTPIMCMMSNQLVVYQNSADLRSKKNTIKGFSGITSVWTPHEGPKKIKDLKKNEPVFSYNLTTETVEPRRIIDLFTNKTSETLKLTINSTTNNDTIETTPNQEFYDPRGLWVAAKLLQIGSRLETTHGSKKITDIEKKRKKRTIYDLTVDQNHNFFVNKEGILVHNMGGEFKVNFDPSKSVTYALSKNPQIRQSVFKLVSNFVNNNFLKVIPAVGTVWAAVNILGLLEMKTDGTKDTIISNKIIQDILNNKVSIPLSTERQIKIMLNGLNTYNTKAQQDPRARKEQQNFEERLNDYQKMLCKPVDEFPGSNEFQEAHIARKVKNWLIQQGVTIEEKYSFHDPKQPISIEEARALAKKYGMDFGDHLTVPEQQPQGIKKVDTVVKDGSVVTVIPQTTTSIDLKKVDREKLAIYLKAMELEKSEFAKILSGESILQKLHGIQNQQLFGTSSNTPTVPTLIQKGGIKIAPIGEFFSDPNKLAIVAAFLGPIESTFRVIKVPITQVTPQKTESTNKENTTDLAINEQNSTDIKTVIEQQGTKPITTETIKDLTQTDGTTQGTHDTLPQITSGTQENNQPTIGQITQPQTTGVSDLKTGTLEQGQPGVQTEEKISDLTNAKSPTDTKTGIEQQKTESVDTSSTPVSTTPITQVTQTKDLPAQDSIKDFTERLVKRYNNRSQNQVPTTSNPLYENRSIPGTSTGNTIGNVIQQHSSPTSSGTITKETISDLIKNQSIPNKSTTTTSGNTSESTTTGNTSNSIFINLVTFISGLDLTDPQILNDPWVRGLAKGIQSINRAPWYMVSSSYRKCLRLFQANLDQYGERIVTPYNNAVIRWKEVSDLDAWDLEPTLKEVEEGIKKALEVNQKLAERVRLENFFGSMALLHELSLAEEGGRIDLRYSCWLRSKNSERLGKQEQASRYLVKLYQDRENIVQGVQSTLQKVENIPDAEDVEKTLNDLEQKLSNVEGISKEQEDLLTKCSVCLGEHRDEYLKLTKEGNEALKKEKEQLVSLRDDNKKKREEQKEREKLKKLEEEKLRQAKVTGQKPPEKDPDEEEENRKFNEIEKSDFFKRDDIRQYFEKWKVEGGKQIYKLKGHIKTHPKLKHVKFLTWDQMHNEVEIWAHEGKGGHLGAIDPLNLEIYKAADPSRILCGR